MSLTVEQLTEITKDCVNDVLNAYDQQLIEKINKLPQYPVDAKYNLKGWAVSYYDLMKIIERGAENDSE